MYCSSLRGVKGKEEKEGEGERETVQHLNPKTCSESLFGTPLSRFAYAHTPFRFRLLASPLSLFFLLTVFYLFSPDLLLTVDIYRHLVSAKAAVGSLYSPQTHLLRATERDDVATVAALIGEVEMRRE